MFVLTQNQNGVADTSKCFGIHIVDESTEFLDIPQWAVIAFKPMEAEKIDPITGELNLYGYEEKNADGMGELICLIFSRRKL